MTEVRDAATVVILREGRAPFELFLLRRHSDHEFMANAWVFPGGRLEDRDQTPEVFDLVEGLSGAEAIRRMGDKVDKKTALGLYVAAVRETFEECGLLLASRIGEEGFISLSDPEIAQRSEELRAAVDNKELGMSEVCRELDVRLSGAEFGFFAHWVTPHFESRRYDTRFFITGAPRNQLATHDDGETTDGAWVTPQMALERYRLGEVLLAPPTIQVLDELAQFSTIDEALEAGRKEFVPPRIMPHLLDGEELILALPGDRDFPSEDPRFVNTDAVSWEKTRMVFRDNQWFWEV